MGVKLFIMANTDSKIASIAFPMVLSGVYDYTIPSRFFGIVCVGMPAFVELRSRKLWGVIVALKAFSPHEKLKELQDVKTDRWSDSDNSLIRLYEWMASYYQCDLGKLFKPFIRKSLIEAKSKFVTVYQTADNLPDIELTDKQTVALQKIKGYVGEELTATICQAALAITPHVLGELCKKGVLVKKRITVLRKSEEQKVAEERAAYGGGITLTNEQVEAVAKIVENGAAKPHLLYGITGSGKTHVYIDLVKKTLEQGQSAIILVPEISLTPQTIQRFRDAVGDCIAVIHSRMSDGERYDSLAELVSGRKRLVIGVRSAILVPIVGLGLIIVDEEHDQSYKQSDTDPRYHARDVAVMRGHMQKATVVLGSATPSLETYYNAQTGKYRLVTLARRFGKAALPGVRVVDMRQEQEVNNWTFLSRYLRIRIEETLAAKRQTILLLNRRGFSTVLICKDCGHVYVCPSCSVRLTYHKSEALLKCHQCGYFQDEPVSCVKCKGQQLKFKGCAIQKAEELLRADFPQARIIRMDQDTTKGKTGHIDIIEAFERRDADILLGTQMVSKGLNFPGVALVGVLAADVGLHFPDFRAQERTFQLLSQVAGRAGRADSDGEVVIQTYFPHDSAIVAAQSHDYVEFYNKEISDREALSYPPFGKLARILVTGRVEAKVRSVCGGIARLLTAHTGIRTLGPAKAAWERLKNDYRYCFLIKSGSPKAIGEAMQAMRRAVAVPRDVRVIVDIDPINML